MKANKRGMHPSTKTSVGYNVQVAQTVVRPELLESKASATRKSMVARGSMLGCYAFPIILVESFFTPDSTLQ